MPGNNEILYNRILLNRRLIVMQIYESIIMLLDIVSLYIFILSIFFFIS